MDGRSWPRADLRVGDDDRQAVVAELQRHYVDGRLNSDELGERVAAALGARTFADLAVPLADLPVLLPQTTDLAESTEPVETYNNWHSHVFSPPLAAILLFLSIFALMMLFAIPHRGGFSMGLFPFWPVLIWGMFLIGRPPRGGRGRRGGPPTHYL